jgi:nitrile hydratase subunit alpha
MAPVTSNIEDDGDHHEHHDHDHHSHDHDDHDHDHEEHSELTDIAARVRALESILIDKGYVDPAALDAIIDTYETKVGPRNGARVVAKAWSDPAYLDRLRSNATAAIAELDYSGRQGEHMVVVENTEDTHNVVVCTLCSCYPWTVLGLPPVWYKAPAYRSRVVLDPRGVLGEFGTELAPETNVRVWDSTAELRYLVLPKRPAGTDGWTEEQLAEIVTRNSMIGTEVVRVPMKAGQA